jgi:hypothetical protein
LKSGSDPKQERRRDKGDDDNADLMYKRKFTCLVDCVKDNCDNYYNPQNRSFSAATHRATAGDHREKRSFEDACFQSGSL